MSSSNCGDCADNEIYEANMNKRIEEIEAKLAEAESELIDHKIAHASNLSGYKELEAKLAEAEKDRDGYKKDFLNYMTSNSAEVISHSFTRAKLNVAIEALKSWIEWEESQIQKDGPYVGETISKLITEGTEALEKITSGDNKAFKREER